MSATNRGGLRAHRDYYATPPWVVDRLLARLPVGEGHPDRWIIDAGCGDGAIIERLLVTAKHKDRLIIGVENDKLRAEKATERFPGTTIVVGSWLETLTIGQLFACMPEGKLPCHARLPIGIISNPPYELALEFICRSLVFLRDSLAPPNSFAAFLLRLGFLESIKRSKLHKKHPAHLLCLDRRPSFCHSFKCRSKAKGGCGNRERYRVATSVSQLACPKCGMSMVKTTSDASAYAWFVYGDGQGGRWEIL
jgi:hypothetical protein